MNEIRIYLISKEETKNVHDTKYNKDSELIRELLIDRAEELGTVYTLSGYATAFNKGEIDLNSKMITTN